MNSFSKDLINTLPDSLLCHILSFLTTKEAASTSVLAKKWCYLLAFVPSLELDDSVYLHPKERIVSKLGLLPSYHVFVDNERKKHSRSFEYFVTRILLLQGNAPIDKFVLKIVDWPDPVDTKYVVPWIHNVLARCVSDLYLVMDLKWKCSLDSRIFLSETLVRLRICIRKGPKIDVGDVCLPKLKTLFLEFVTFRKDDIGLSKLLSGCHVLEELVIYCIKCCVWNSCSVSVSTLKRVTVNCAHCFRLHKNIPKSVSFDVPSLVYLEYTERIANKYPKANLHSLVEAKVDLQTPWVFGESDEEPSDDSELEGQILQGNVVGNATDFMTGICNVRILYLSATTLQVLTFYCKAIPIFSNLTHLAIQSKPELGWESVAGLLNNCPNLQTLAFQGLLHRATDKCGDVCLCKPREEEDGSSYLSSSGVKVLKILMNNSEMEKQIEQVKYFLETMPHLEQLVFYYNSSFDEAVEIMPTQLQMLTKVASSKCKVRLIPSTLSASPSVRSTEIKWVPLL